MVNKMLIDKNIRNYFDDILQIVMHWLKACSFFVCRELDQLFNSCTF